MTDTKSQLESMITYLLGVMWEQGELLRKPGANAGTTKRARTIHTLALAISALNWPVGDNAPAQPDAEKEPEAETEPQPPPEPQVEPVEWDQERPQPTEEPQPA